MLSKRAALLICAVVAYILWRRRRASRLAMQISQPKNPKVLITLSGGGQLSFYFHGVCAYLRENFNLDNARFAGISMGSSIATSLATGMPQEAAILFSFRWLKRLETEGFYFMNTSDVIREGLSIADEFGISEKWANKRLEADDRPDLYYGLTSVSHFPWKHVIVTDFATRKERMYAMSCSMRILPFFKTVGYYQGNYVIDGGFSAFYTIPEDADPDRTIRISPLRYFPADIQPNRFEPENCLPVYEAFITPSTDDMLRHFRIGYNDAFRKRPNVIAKGLVPKDEPLYNLDYWTNYIRTNAKVYFDHPLERQISRADLSRSMGNLFETLDRDDIKDLKEEILLDENGIDQK